MQQGGFSESRRANPVGLGLVFALHAGVLGAIILTPPDTFKRVIYKTLTTYPVHEQKPPPPLPEQTKADKPTRIAKVDREVNVTPNDFTDIRPVDPLPADPLPLPPRPEIKPDPPQAPVLVEAKPDPRFASALQPPYPSAMARQEIEGKVVVRVLIGVDGRVKAVEPVSATDPAFHEATAAQALRRWRFRPATKDGVAVESWRTMTVRFQLET
jgi:protein TonB